MYDAPDLYVDPVADMRLTKTLLAVLLLPTATTTATAYQPYFAPPVYGPPPYHRAPVTGGWAQPGRTPEHYAYYVPRPWMAPASRKPATAAGETGGQPAPSVPAATEPQIESDSADRDAETAVTPAPTAKSPSEKQQAFFEQLQPLVEQENRRLLETRAAVSRMVDGLDAGRTLSATQRQRLKGLASRYRVDGDPVEDAGAREALLDKLDMVPVSLALAQAANESAWGKSRFAREGNNLFGIWTYDESKGIVPRKRAPGKKHLVRKFDSLAESVRYYLFTLNSHPAYAELREIRSRLRAAGEPLDGLAMAEGLTRYSAKGNEYVRLIQGMIRRFDLAVYDAAPSDRA